MDAMPIALILIQGTVQEAHSALPDAPVVPHVDKVPVAQRTRRAFAGGLRNLADVVGPPRSVGHGPAQNPRTRTTSTRTGTG
jgi:hypothetical protein